MHIESERFHGNFGQTICQGESDSCCSPTTSAPPPRFQTAVVRFGPESIIRDGAWLTASVFSGLMKLVRRVKTLRDDPQDDFKTQNTFRLRTSCR